MHGIHRSGFGGRGHDRIQGRLGDAEAHLLALHGPSLLDAQCIQRRVSCMLTG
ncbi:hypothetical protein D3C80_2176850 [compost metagenome]